MIYIIRLENIPILDFTNRKALLSMEILINIVIETILIITFVNTSKFLSSNTIQAIVPNIICIKNILFNSPMAQNFSLTTIEIITHIRYVIAVAIEAPRILNLGTNIQFKTNPKTNAEPMRTGYKYVFSTFVRPAAPIRKYP